MSKRWLRLGFVAGLLAGVACLPAQAGFMPLFQVVDVSGDCQANPPGDEGPKALAGGEGFAYGTTLTTGPDGTLTILLSPDNRIVLGPNARVILNEDPSSGIKKIIHLYSGKMAISLAPDFEKENALSILSRCLTVHFLSGGNCTAESTTEADLNVIILASQGAQFSIDGPEFTVPLLKENDGLTVACADDLSFVRLRDTDGKYTVQVKDSNGQDHLTEMVKDSVIKILRKPSEADSHITIVTILIIGPDGEVIEAITYPIEETNDPVLGGSSSSTEGGPTPTTGSTEDFPTTTSSSTSSTTTTTVPPGDTTTTQPPPTTTTQPPKKTPPPPPPTTTTKPDPTPTGRN